MRSNTPSLGGTFTFPGTSMTVNRLGYGAMQLAGPGVYGPPKDPAQAASVLREAIAAGVDHIDTSDFYGPHVTNQLIHDTLYPYPKNLVLVTKVGARREADKSWHPAATPAELTAQVHDNLRRLKVDALDAVNLRLFGDGHGPSDGSVEERFTALAKLQQQGLIKHLGLSNCTAGQVTEALKIAPVICVQNYYNVAQRMDDALIADLAKRGIAYVPFFPLGGFTPLQSSALDSVAREAKATAMQVALAWLLQRSPNILLIPGTSSLAHLRENLASASLTLSPRMVKELDEIGPKATTH